MTDFKPYSEQPELHATAPYRSSMLTYPGNLRKALADAQAPKDTPRVCRVLAEDARRIVMGGEDLGGQGVPEAWMTASG